MGGSGPAIRGNTEGLRGTAVYLTQGTMEYWWGDIRGAGECCCWNRGGIRGMASMWTGGQGGGLA